MIKYIFGATVVVVAALFVGGEPNAHAAVATIPATVSEFPTGPFSNEFQVHNQSHTTPNPFDFTLLVVSTQGVNPSTTNPNWTAEALNPLAWERPMGNADSHLPSWHQYTGLVWPFAIPSDPLHANGYFLNYTYDPLNGQVIPSDPVIPTDPIRPGQIRGGFFFEGVVNSTFLVAGPTDATQPFTLGNVQTFSAETQIVPEPGTLALCIVLAVSVGGVACWRRWKKGLVTAAVQR